MNAPRWLVLYHHNRGGSSWWGERVVRAASAPEAAEALDDKISEHAGPSDPGLRVTVYGPIPEEGESFWVTKKTEVTAREAAA